MQRLLVRNDRVENILMGLAGHVFTRLGFSPLNKVRQKLLIYLVEYRVAPAPIKSINLCDKNILGRGGTPLDPIIELTPTRVEP